MEDKPPKRKMPEFEISKEQTEELRTISAVTKALADNPELIKEIVAIFKQVEMEKQQELTDRVSKLLAENVSVKPELISAVIENLYPIVVPQWWRFVAPHKRCQPMPLWRF
jgi:hypothetical protein